MFLVSVVAIVVDVAVEVDLALILPGFDFVFGVAAVAVVDALFATVVAVCVVVAAVVVAVVVVDLLVSAVVALSSEAVVGLPW